MTYKFPIDSKAVRRKMWTKVVQSGKDNTSRERKYNKFGAPVDLKADTPKKSPNEIEKAELVTVFASFLAIGLAQRGPDRGGRLSARGHGLTNVSRQSPNSRGRKRTAQGPRGIQARARREVRSAILHHELRREGCSSVSLRGMGADRAEAGRALHFQSDEEKVSRPNELLGPASGDGRPGAALDAATAARVGADQRRGGRDRAADVSGSAEPRGLSPRDRGEQVHARG